jgi:integrase
MTGATALREAAAGLVASKRATGREYVSEERVLERFARFAESASPDADTVTRGLAEAWIADARARGVKPATLGGLATPVRQLALWLARQGTPAYAFPGRELPKTVRYAPHVYTDSELAAFFHQTDLCRPCPEVPSRHLVMPVVFRLIYGCGLRASEARLLRPDDVGADAAVVQIRDAKGGKDRQVPLSEPLRARMAAYRERNRARIDEWFFPGFRGGPLTLGNLYRNFRRFLWQARIPHGGPGQGPRIHDFRTTFAVNNLRFCFAAGRDPAALLPVLQTYMGHASIQDTAYYLHLAAASRPDVTARVEAAGGDLAPHLPTLPEKDNHHGH